MGEGHKRIFHGISSPQTEEDTELSESMCLSSDSSDSIFSSSSDLTDDATFSSPDSSLSSSHLDSDGPLYGLSSLMGQLAIKRGLSKYYQGKSESFKSLSDVICIEDLAKKESPYRARKTKASKSYGGLDSSQKPSHVPGTCSKRTISKTAYRGSCASWAARRNSTGLLCRSKPHPIPLYRFDETGHSLYRFDETEV